MSEPFFPEIEAVTYEGPDSENLLAYRFYAAEISYFSAKVRPSLRYKGLHFVELLPTPEAYRDVILKRTGLGFIPVVVTPEDETLQAEMVAMQKVGVVTEACVACARRYGVEQRLKELGLDVKSMGKPLSDRLKDDWKVITF